MQHIKFHLDSHKRIKLSTRAMGGNPNVEKLMSVNRKTAI